MKNLSAYKLIPIFTVILLTAVNISCTNSPGTGINPSTGKVNELLIVTNDKGQWETELGDTLRAFFSGPQIGLPQPEPIFSLLNVADENFTDIFQKFHTIFIVDINPQADKTVSETSQDAWAQPQRVIKVTAPDLASFYTEFDLKKESFMKLFIDLERQRTLTINKLATDPVLSGKVRDKFGIYLPLPEGFYIAKESLDFMWLRHTVTKVKQDVELGIMIYSADYKDTVVFNPKHILKWRNMITLEHIPGPSPLSYMVVAQDDMAPVVDTITDFPGGYAVETRGIWKVENDFMGGPFINYTAIDKAKNKVLTLDGYIYYPNQDKNSYLRQLEAIFFASKFEQQVK
jgi:hypothetical protein